MLKKAAIGLLLVLLVLLNIYTPYKIERIHIDIKPEVLGYIGPMAITNSMVGGWVSTVLLIVLAVVATRHMVDTPKAGSIQNMVEAGLEALYDYVSGFGGTHTRAFFPMIGALFLYILVSNWLSVIPGIMSIGLWRENGGEPLWIPLIKPSTSDLNTTVALALFSVGAAQVFGLRFRGLLRHLERYISIGCFIQFGRELLQGKRPSLSLLFEGALDLFVGFLDIVEELTKVLSFSFRLFGNVFGGEVLLAVIAYLAPYAVSVPFLILELMFGFIQAFVFVVLSAAFFAQAASGHDPTPKSPINSPAAPPA